MGIDDALAAGGVGPEQFAQLEQRVMYLENARLSDGGALTNNYTINENGEVEPVEAGLSEAEVIEIILEVLGLEFQGDLLTVDSEGELAVLEAGEDGQVLTADSSLPTGLFWDGPVEPPEGNEGEEVPAELAKWIVVGQNVQSVPDDNEPTISQQYDPPQNTDLLAVVFCQFDDGGAPENTGIEVPTLGGVEPDSVTTQANSAGNKRGLGIAYFENPKAGLISVALAANTSSYMFLAVSIKNQGGEALAEDETKTGEDSGDASEETKTLSINLPFPGVFLSCISVFQNAVGFSTERTGTRILKKQNDASGASGTQRFEVCVGLIGSGANNISYKLAEGAESVRYLASGVTEEEV